MRSTKSFSCAAPFTDLSHIENFQAFVTALKGLQQRYAHINLYVLDNANLEILIALSNHLDDITNYYYTKTELHIFKEAHDINCKIKNDTIDKIKSKILTEDLRKLELAASFKIRNDIRANLLEELDNPNKDKNIFVVLETKLQVSDETISLIRSIKNKWEEQKYLCMVSPESISKMQADLERFSEYAKILKEELKLGDNSWWATYYRYANNLMDLEFLEAITGLLNQLNKLIQKKQETIVAVMLAKLSLLPDYKFQVQTSLAHALQDENDNENSKYPVDAIFTTLQSLTQVGLSSEYVEKLRKKISWDHCLTEKEIRNFNSYIDQFGTVEQKQARNNCYAKNQHNNALCTQAPKICHTKNVLSPLSPLAEDKQEKITTVLIPTEVVGHYSLKIKMTSSFVSSSLEDSLILFGQEEERKIKLDEIDLEGSHLLENEHASHQNDYSELQEEENPNLFELNHNLQGSAMGNSFIDMGTGERVYIPSQLMEVEINSANLDDVKKMYELVRANDFPNEIDINEFVYIGNEKDLATLKFTATKFFHNKNHQDFFVAVMERLRLANVDAKGNVIDNDQIKIAFDETANWIIKCRRTQEFEITTDDTANYIEDLQKIFNEIATVLKEKFYVLDNTEKFESYVIAKTLEVIHKIENCVLVLQREMREIEFSDDKIQFFSKIFIKKASHYFTQTLSNDKSSTFSNDDLSSCLLKAELDTLIESHASLFEKNDEAAAFKQEIKKEIKEKISIDPAWLKQKDNWVLLLNEKRKFIHLQQTLTDFFHKERARINCYRFFKSGEKTKIKLEAIDTTIGNIQDKDNYKQLTDYAHAILDIKANADLHCKRGYLSRFSFLSSSTMTQHLNKFVDLHISRDQKAIY